VQLGELKETVSELYGLIRQGQAEDSARRVAEAERITRLETQIAQHARVIAALGTACLGLAVKVIYDIAVK
jgi:hypothetical protein